MSSEDVAETVRAVIDAGAVGINLEDSIGRALLPPERQAERIRAALVGGIDGPLNIMAGPGASSTAEPRRCSGSALPG
jgi:2-methylisocitrate lyase-like PEP mutase family enzyme